MLSSGRKEYHSRPRNSKHKGEYSITLITIGLALVTIFVIYRIYSTWVYDKLDNIQDVEFVSYYEPKDSFNIRSQAVYYEQFLSSLVEQPNCPLFTNGNLLNHSNNTTPVTTTNPTIVDFVESFTFDSSDKEGAHRDNYSGPLTDFYKFVDGIDQQPLALIAPWKFVYGTNNIEHPNKVSIISVDSLGTKSKIKVRIDFENAYWPCVGASPTMEELLSHVTHYDRMGDGNMSRIQSGSVSDIIGYATKDTTVSFYKWDKNQNTQEESWIPISFNDAMVYVT